MFEMTRDVPWAMTKMLAEPISDIGHRRPGGEDDTPGDEELPGGADAPQKGLHFSGKKMFLLL